MKTITSNLTKFAIAATVLTIIFRYALTFGIDSRSNYLVIFSALTYAGSMFLSDYAKELESNRDDKAGQAAKEKRENYGFENTKILAGNVGYIKLRYFADTSNSKHAAFNALKSIRDTKSLMLDLRGNSGGSGTMVQLLCSSFLPAGGEPLLQIMYKHGDTVTLKTYPDSNRFIYTNPIFIFCDQNTFNAAEAFTLIMKNRGRAIIIGDTTAGAGNIAGPHFLTDDFIITIPVGRIVDPLTQKGWDGAGVSPDILTSKR